MEPPAAKLTFTDGYTMDCQTICLAARTEQDIDTGRSHITAIKGDKWVHAPFDDLAISVTGIPRDKLALFLGCNGSVFVGTVPAVGRGTRSIEFIPSGEEVGDLLRIRNIADRIYACGMSGQVYSREGTVWRPMDQGIRGEVGLDLEDIGGTAANDLYAVASSGTVCHYDGLRWTKLDFPANRPLSGVLCIGRDDVYICGDDGNLFRGNMNRWEFVGDPTFRQNFWAVEKYDDKIFVAYNDGLLSYNGATLTEVDFGVDGEIDCYRLHANDGVLWSFGEEHLLSFDGSTWHRIL
jgi:hypothetical protein